MIRCPSCAKVYCSQAQACPGCEFSPKKIDGFSCWAPEVALGGNGFKAEYFEHLATVEKDNFWFRSRNSLIVWALKRYFPSFRSFLEVGCGTGFVLQGIAKAFPEAEIIGSEIFVQGLKFAAGRVPTGQFLQMDGRRIPYQNEFDLIGAFDVLEHILEDDVVLAGMYRALKPGGGLVVTVPQHPWLWSATDQYACHVRRYSAADLHFKLKNAGFEIVLSTSFVTLSLPAMLIARRRNAGKDFDPCGEFHLSGWIDQTLELSLRLEQRLIRMGACLPIGGSRFVVGRRRVI
jgi:SAM-dependent methyltransferase